MFTCYDVPDLPRTNHDLEQYFGTARYLERRATGRNGASPALVVRGAVRGAVRVVAALAPRPRALAAWKRQRQQVEARHATRRAQARFRRDPHAYLASLEEIFLKPALPP